MTESIRKNQSKKQGDEPSVQNNKCKVDLVIDKKGWRLKLEDTPECKKELSKLNKLPEAVEKYMKKHIEFDDKDE